MADDNRIKATYVSPTVRLAFLREDHPNATVTYAVLSAEELGIPPVFLDGVEHFVVCDLTLTPGEPPIRAWKEVRLQEERWVTEGARRVKRMQNVRLTPEALVVLQTKALGRACKLAGYPDDLDDFKALVLWRTRNRQIAAIGPKPGELEAAVAALPAAERDDDGVPVAASQDVDDGGDIEDGDVVEPLEAADEPDMWSELMNDLPAPARARLAQWANEELGIRNVMRRPDDKQAAARIVMKAQEFAQAEQVLLTAADEEAPGDGA